MQSKPTASAGKQTGMHRQWHTRSAFVFFFPIVLGLILYFIFAGSLQRFRNARQERAEDEWLNRANILAARVRSEYTIERQAEQSFKAIADYLEKASNSTDHELASLLKQSFVENLDPEIALQCQTWAFLQTHDRFELIEGDGLMNQKKRAFIRVFEALCHLAGDTGETSGNRLHERFISGMFGENSSPQHLATERQGRMTPVIFEGKHRYLCWRVLELGQNRFIGFISLLPGAFVEDAQAALQRLADRISKTDPGIGLAVFANSPQLEPVFKPIVPEHLHKDAESIAALQVLKKHWGHGSLKPRQINPVDGRWLFHDFIDTETSYSFAIISAAGNAPSAPPWPAAFAIIALLTWVVYFLQNRRQGSLSLSTTFRLLFFMTGMLPVALLVIMVLHLIDESAEIRIRSRINDARTTLRNFDQKSENTSNWCAMLLSDLLKRPELQEQFATPYSQRQGFASLDAELKKRNYNLQYMLIFQPGHEPCHISATPAHTAMARFHLDYFAVACESISRLFALYSPQMPAIKMSAMQKTLLGIFDNMGKSVARELFLDSVERLTYMKTGTSSINFFYNSIIIDERGLPVYLVISVSTMRTLEYMLDHDLMHANRNGETTFACFNRNLSTARRIIPATARQFIGSENGQTLLNLAESAASSQIGLILRQSGQIYVYEPMPQLGAWYGGAAIDISDLAREADWRQFLLLCSFCLMALFIYVLSAGAASLFIGPTGLLSGIFAAIATGDFRQRFEYEYDNELGELATATNNMVVGLKERQMLGKFVSTTFDNQIASATAQTSAQKLAGVILFSDVRSFTTHSEANPPVLISQMLNQHLRGMVEAINSNGGRVDQFIGDAVVAFFPGDSADSCLNAVRAAAAMMRRHHQIIAERRQRKLFAYDIGIGLAYGTVIAGALASGSRSEFTIIGSARSVAEQLETQSKSSRHTAIIISESLIHMIPELKQHFCAHNEGSYELLDLEAPL
ncbi:MAG: hypothetical protein CVV42_14105 [Candidatus Riflebacteria bacterium HGW-Riflebacteria-2]|nr:MAG: hypothetical protein CVV42_14105 [Candidatus Riflebacteria bacterium HGW-Riflebacteria-2]